MSTLPHLLIDHIAIFNDNYVWALSLACDDIYDEAINGCVVIVDPGDDKAVKSYLKKHNKTLAGIVITHSHWDHVGGVEALVNNKSLWFNPAALPVYGHHSIACVNTPVDHLEHFMLWPQANIACHVMATPGHMPEHLSYFIDDVPHSHPINGAHNTKHHYALFCGDTLFHGGCGRIFDGTPKELQNSLDRLQALPDATQVYCTHEYTKSNLAFAKTIDPNNAQLLDACRHVDDLRACNTLTLPTNIQMQKAINPFLRYRLPHIQARIAHDSGQVIDSDDDAFRLLRLLKDAF